MKVSMWVRLFAGAAIMAEASRIGTKFATAAAYKDALKKQVQSHHAIPGFIRGMACSWIDNIPGETPVDVFLNIAFALGYKPVENPA